MRIAYDYSNALGGLALCGSPASTCIITPTSTKNHRVGALSVQSDNPSKGKDKNSNNGRSSKPKHNQEQRQSSNQAKLEKDSSQSKNTQTRKGKQHGKKLNTLGGYAGRVMVGD